MANPEDSHALIAGIRDQKKLPAAFPTRAVAEEMLGRGVLPSSRREAPHEFLIPDI
jgi:hypothetical protein